MGIRGLNFHSGRAGLLAEITVSEHASPIGSTALCKSLGQPPGCTISGLVRMSACGCGLGKNRDSEHRWHLATDVVKDAFDLIVIAVYVAGEVGTSGRSRGPVPVDCGEPKTVVGLHVSSCTARDRTGIEVEIFPARRSNVQQMQTGNAGRTRWVTARDRVRQTVGHDQGNARDITIRPRSALDRPGESQLDQEYDPIL